LLQIQEFLSSLDFCSTLCQDKVEKIRILMDFIQFDTFILHDKRKISQRIRQLTESFYLPMQICLFKTDQ